VEEVGFVCLRRCHYSGRAPLPFYSPPFGLNPIPMSSPPLFPVGNSRPLSVRTFGPSVICFPLFLCPRDFFPPPYQYRMCSKNPGSHVHGIRDVDWIIAYFRFAAFSPFSSPLSFPPSVFLLLKSSSGATVLPQLFPSRRHR